MKNSSNWFIILFISIIVLDIFLTILDSKDLSRKSNMVVENNCWTGAGVNQLPVDEDGALIRYGRELIENTAFFLGPMGKVAKISNEIGRAHV